jgi:hypothetical protein
VATSRSDYTPIVLGIMFFGALTSLGFGIIGQYLWLLKDRPPPPQLHRALRREHRP